MKVKTTRKSVQSAFINCIQAGYCELQSLLYYREPIAYTTGKYGWSADIYEVTPTTAIVTGYTSFGNILAPYELCQKYELRAEKIRANVRDYSTARKELDKLINEFVKEVLK